MRVSIFGGSHPAEGSPAYAEAFQLGRDLAKRGWTVLTGGYIGTMEAVSRGAAEAGGHVIGVTCEELERSYGRRVNRWVKEEWKKETLLERLAALTHNCDAALALPGGPGTLTEIALTWNLMIVRGLSPRPLILIGGAWHSVMDEFLRKLGEYIAPEQRELLAFSPSAEQAVQMLVKMGF
jgi:uncharacterized protein (TIGR00730 family)